MGKRRWAEAKAIEKRARYCAVRTRNEVAKIMGCSVEWVRQIELSALWRLKHGLIAAAKGAEI